MDSDKDLRERAWEHHRKGELSEAENLYKILIQNEPRDIDIANLGALLRRSNRCGDALQLYGSWINKGIRSEGLLGNAVNAAIDAKEIQLAKQWISLGKKITDSSYKFELAECRLLEESKETELALRMLDKCIQRTKNVETLLRWVMYSNWQINGDRFI